MGTSDFNNPMDALNEDAAFYRESYYQALRKLVAVCGEYSGKIKLLQNAADGISKVQAVVDKYYSDSDNQLLGQIKALEAQRKAALENFQYWSTKVGFKPMSTPGDVEKHNLEGRADTTILLNYLNWPAFRTVLYKRIDKYAKKAELKSIANLATEVLQSETVKKSRRPS